MPRSSTQEMTTSFLSLCLQMFTAFVPYLNSFQDSAAELAWLQILSNLIVINTFVPISLYVRLEQLPCPSSTPQLFLHTVVSTHYRTKAKECSLGTRPLLFLSFSVPSLSKSEREKDLAGFLGVCLGPWE